MQHDFYTNMSLCTWTTCSTETKSGFGVEVPLRYRSWLFISFSRSLLHELINVVCYVIIIDDSVRCLEISKVTAILILEKTTLRRFDI